MIQQLLASFGASGATYPHVADANARLSLTAEQVGSGTSVADAGSASTDGTYTERPALGMNNGKPVYNLLGQPDSLDNYVIKASVFARWNIYDGSGTDMYRSNNDDAGHPWESSSWESVTGDNPAPTVARVTGAGYRVIQDDNSTLYEFLGDGLDADAGLWVTGAGDATYNSPYGVVGARYDQLPGFSSIRCEDAGSGEWTLNAGAYVITTPSTHPWDTTWVNVGASDPPPTVIRNPIVSENNWVVIP